MEAALNAIKAFDAYPKTLDDFRVKTKSGAAITLVTGFFILVLFLSELVGYIRYDVRSDMSVDITRNEKLKINFNITFPKMACSVVSVDVMDIAGDQQLDVEHQVFKKRLSADGDPISPSGYQDRKLGGEEVPKSVATRDDNYCGSCYGAEDDAKRCCNTCEEVREQYRKKGWAFTDPDSMEQCIAEGFTEKLKAQRGEGCNLYGQLLVNKVAGNFHFAPGKSFQHSSMHVHDFMPFEIAGFNMSHTIHSLSFGEYFPGLQNPLDYVTKEELDGARMFQYFLKVVPTKYQYLNGRVLTTNQFSVTESEKKVDPMAGRGLPGAFFMFEISPIKITYTETRKSFGHFITSVFALIGGMFTVAGIIDSFVYHGARMVARKMELGKQQ